MSSPDTTSDPPARPCSNCGAGMERHQDWCLECGTAAPGRLGGLRPGWRAVTTTLGLTLVLVAGAGAASYAALSSDANREAIAAAPMDGTPVAQAPPPVPAPAAPLVTPPAAPGVPVAPAVPAVPVAPGTPGTPAAGVPVPTVTSPAPKLPVAPKVVPVAPATGKSTAQVKPKATTPRTKPGSGDTAAGSRGAGTNADGKDTKVDTPLTPIALDKGSVSVYDPYERAVAPGNPARAHDDDAKTSFEVGAPEDGKDLQVGVVIDLKSVKQVRALEIATKTPGGRLEVYATDSSALPSDILDTRWDHPASRANVDGGTRGGNKAGDGLERVVLPKGGAKYRYVTLWFTTPPTGTRRVGLTEIKILG